MSRHGDRTIAVRVARRFLGAGVTLLPDYKKALASLEEGNPDPLLDFCKTVIALLFPDGDYKPVSWFHGLGTAKRNSLNALQKEMRVFLLEGTSLKTFPVLIPQWVGRVQKWAKGLRTLELASVADDDTRVVKHGPFEIVPMPGITKAQLEGAVAALDAASTKLRPKFPKVLYGKVYLSNHLQKGKAAWYVPSEDKFYLDINVTKRFDDVYTILHELGHRYDHKFLAKDLKKKFWDLSTRKVYETVSFDEELRSRVADEAVQLTKDRSLGKSGLSMSPELTMWLKGPYLKGDPRRLTSDFLAGKITEQDLHDGIKGSKNADLQTDKLLRGPLAVTRYGQTKPSENWAEAFAHYVLDMKMPQEFVAILSQA